MKLPTWHWAAGGTVCRGFFWFCQELGAVRMTLTDPAALLSRPKHFRPSPGLHCWQRDLCPTGAAASTCRVVLPRWSLIVPQNEITGFS